MNSQVQKLGLIFSLENSIGASLIGKFIKAQKSPCRESRHGLLKEKSYLENDYLEALPSSALSPPHFPQHSDSPPHSPQQSWSCEPPPQEENKPMERTPRIRRRFFIIYLLICG